jgi:hypothetical protein
LNRLGADQDEDDDEEASRIPLFGRKALARRVSAATAAKKFGYN